MNDWKKKGEKDIRMVREVAREAGKDSFTKGGHNFTEMAVADAVKSCDGSEDS